MQTLRDRLTRRWTGASCAAERGATVVEAALITPLFVFIIFALVEIGPLFSQWSSGKNTATEGGRMAATAGASVTADWDTFREIRSSATKLGTNLDYVIIFRAASVKSEVPPECITSANANRNAPSTQPVGAFRATSTSPLVTDYTSHAVEDFDWNSGTPVDIACTVLYPRQLTAITSSGPFIYERTKVLAVAPSVPEYSLNRFWPGQLRVDYLNGPQDYVGVYVQSRYVGPTGIMSSRTIRSTSINQIEPKRASR
jgi:Flp pilus assembly protein TadG